MLHIAGIGLQVALSLRDLRNRSDLLLTQVYLQR